MTITNDGATILKLLEVEHPAAKVLCELADLQDKEVGDGTTSVVCNKFYRQTRGMLTFHDLRVFFNWAIEERSQSCVFVL